MADRIDSWQDALKILRERPYDKSFIEDKDLKRTRDASAFLVDNIDTLKTRPIFIDYFKKFREHVVNCRRDLFINSWKNELVGAESPAPMGEAAAREAWNAQHPSGVTLEESLKMSLDIGFNRAGAESSAARHEAFKNLIKIEKELGLANNHSVGVRRRPQFFGGYARSGRQ